MESWQTKTKQPIRIKCEVLSEYMTISHISYDPGASFEGGWGPSPPPPQGKRKKKKEEKKKERKKGTKNNVKLRHIKCCFFQFFNSLVASKNKKKCCPPRKSWNDAPVLIVIFRPIYETTSFIPLERPGSYSCWKCLALFEWVLPEAVVSISFQRLVRWWRQEKQHHQIDHQSDLQPAHYSLEMAIGSFLSCRCRNLRVENIQAMRQDGYWNCRTTTVATKSTN